MPKKIATTNIGVNNNTGRPLFAKGSVIPDSHPNLEDWTRYGMVQEANDRDELEEVSQSVALQFDLPIKADAPSAPLVEETEEMKKTREAARTLQTKEQEIAADKAGQVKDLQRGLLAAKVAEKDNKKALTAEEKKKAEDEVEQASKATQEMNKKDAKPAEEVGGDLHTADVSGGAADAMQTKAIDTKPVPEEKADDKSGPKTTPKNNTEK